MRVKVTRITGFVMCVSFVAAFTTRAPGADKDGFVLLQRAAKEAPREVPEAGAAPPAMAQFLERGHRSWDLCSNAVDAKIRVPPALDVTEIAEFRPLFRLLVVRARHASRNSDMGITVDTLRVLFAIAEAFHADVDLHSREGGFIADVYLMTILGEAAPRLDRDSCEKVSELLARYLKGWAPIGRLFDRQIEEDRRKIGEEAVKALDGSGIREKARATLEKKVKLRQTLYKLLAAKLSIRMFLLEFSRLPDGLDELKSIDTDDPYSDEGGPFRYRVDRSVYTIYSVGPDGHDDGGARRSLSEHLRGAKGDLTGL